jgi:predicted peroxiredoxin
MPEEKEKKEKIVFIATHAGEEPERASYPLMLANAAQSMDVEAVVILQSDGVYLAKKGYADDISVPGFTPLKQLIDNYVANGGKFLL